MRGMTVIAIALLPVLAIGVAGCVAGSGAQTASESGSVLRSVAEEISNRAQEAKAQIEREREERERAERERIEREERERAEAARREQERINAWRARFPLDDYSNTLLIGDSIMQNATEALEDALPGVDINADAGRTLERGGVVFENKARNKGVLDHVRNDDGSYDRYVIGTGNNDNGGMPLSAAEEIIELLGDDKEIYFVTEIVTGNAYGTAVTNDSIANVVERYENVHVIDWHGLVVGHEDEYLSDGCHPRSSRLGDYAACIKEGLDVVY